MRNQRDAIAGDEARIADGAGDVLDAFEQSAARSRRPDPRRRARPALRRAALRALAELSSEAFLSQEARGDHRRVNALPARGSPVVRFPTAAADKGERARDDSASFRRRRAARRAMQRLPRASAQLDDALRDRSPDPRHGGKLRGIGPVDVDALGGGVRRTAACACRCAESRTRRLTGERNVDFVTVGRTLREIDRAGIGGGTQSAGQRDRLRVAVARAQMIEPRLFHRAGDVDDQVVVICLRLRAVTVPPLRHRPAKLDCGAVAGVWDWTAAAERGAKAQRRRARAPPQPKRFA